MKQEKKPILKKIAIKINKIAIYFKRAIKAIDIFLIQCYFLIFYKKFIKKSYENLVKQDVNGWRTLNELEYYYWFILDSYSLLPIIQFKKIAIFKSKLQFKIPVSGRIGAKLYFQFVHKKFINSNQSYIIPKPDRNDKCICGSNKKFKVCCLKGWNKINPKLPTVRRLQIFKKRTIQKNPFVN